MLAASVLPLVSCLSTCLTGQTEGHQTPHFTITARRGQRNKQPQPSSSQDVLMKYGIALADLGFFRGGDSGNPSERSERALRGSGLTEE